MGKRTKPYKTAGWHFHGARYLPPQTLKHYETYKADKPPQDEATITYNV